MGISRDVYAREHAGPTALPHSVPVGDPFQRMFGIGRTTQWQLIELGEVESVLIGAPGRARARPGRGRRVIIVASYLAYMERQKQREAAGEIKIASPNPRARQAPAPAIAERSTPQQRRGAAARPPRSRGASRRS